MLASIQLPRKQQHSGVHEVYGGSRDFHRKGDKHDRQAQRQLTENEWQKFIQNFLKTGKAPGQDGIQNELIKTMTDNEKEVLRIWANEVLQDDNPAAPIASFDKAVVELA